MPAAEPSAMHHHDPFAAIPRAELEAVTGGFDWSVIAHNKSRAKASADSLSSLSSLSAAPAGSGGGGGGGGSKAGKLVGGGLGFAS